jgi:heterodisulfide reductase subunit A-like polyferredoxin
MVDLGIANVVARSPFVNRVDEDLCTGCGECLEYCQFTALAVDGVAQVQEMRCAGCGICIQFCQQGALRLERRSGEVPPPTNDEDWRSARRATFQAE